MTNTTIHPFEAAGLGLAPFRVVGVTRVQAARVVYGRATETRLLRPAAACHRHGLATLGEALYAQAMAARARHYPESRRLYEARARELLAEVAP